MCVLNFFFFYRFLLFIFFWSFRILKRPHKKVTLNDERRRKKIMCTMCGAEMVASWPIDLKYTACTSRSQQGPM
jgi:hypothetical protein